jgi:hypothetical protein
VTETAAAAAGVRPGADGHDLEVGHRGCNPQVHTENLVESDLEEDA